MLRAQQADLMFLDLNMPQMDGYEVLEHIRAEDLPIMTIVVSGDIQPEAQERVRKLGAIDFIKSPQTSGLFSACLRITASTALVILKVLL